MPFALLKVFAKAQWHSDVQLHGKTVIVTGSNTGIGKETARDFVKRGARVILACRNLEKANQAAEEIQKDGNGEVIVKHLDLSSFQSIRKFAEDIATNETRLDILVNNAGLAGDKSRTVDGHDLTFGTNHLGPFLLTNLLLNKLKESAPSRIVNVSSKAHVRVTEMDWDDLNLDKPGSYSIVKSYSQSKLANVLFTKELAVRLQGTGVNAYCLHPGVINTEIWRNLPGWLRAGLNIVAPLILKSPAQGAQTTIYCAVSEEVKDESGLYYSDCAHAKTSAAGSDPAAAKRLWEISLKMTGLENSSA